MKLKKLLSAVAAGAIAVMTFVGVMPSIVPEISESTLVSAEVVDSGSCGANLTWEFDSEGTLTISGNGKMTDYNILNYNSYYNSPFCNNSNIKKVVISDGVTSIGDCAFFECSSLKSVTIPDSVTSIGDHAFYYCSSLKSVTIPDSVTSIGDRAFSGCRSLTGITIPNSVTSIGGSAFRGTVLTEITIPNSVTSIGDDAFGSCLCLRKIDVSKDNENYSVSDGILFNKDKTKLISYPAGKNGILYVIPDSVSCIGDDAFDSCSSLFDITIPDSVTSIGESAFYYCDRLESITIPDSVTSIGESAFYYCDRLESITIPDSVKCIGDGTFERCRNLRSVTIPNSVTSIGSFEFADCTGLTDITIPNSVTSIGDYAFLCCTGLKEITIPNSVTSIGEYAFSGCDGLTIRGYSDSYAKTYAAENNIPFKYISDEPKQTTPAVTTATQPMTAQPTTTTTTATTGTTTEATKIIVGDVDDSGFVELADIAALSKYLLNSASYPLNGENSQARADVTHDNNVDTLDVSKLIEYNLGKIKGFD